MNEVAPDRDALRTALDGLLLRVGNAFRKVLQDPRAVAEVNAITNEMRRAIDPPHERNWKRKSNWSSVR